MTESNPVSSLLAPFIENLYRMAWHIPESGKGSVTRTVARWQEFAPGVIPLPHPSPRNNIWLKRNPWFGETLLPELKELVARALT